MMQQVSMVFRCHDTETHPITFDEIWDATRSGKHGLKGKITQIRNRYEAEKDITGSPEKAKKAIAELKLDLPGFLPSGTFTKRENSALVEHSGILCADLDSLGGRLPGIKGILQQLPFVRAIALSPSGDGLKVFFNVLNDPARHEDSFRSIQQNLRDIELEIDEKCKDPARICFFTYDPELWIRAEGNEIIPPADPLPRVSKPYSSTENLTKREQIAFGLVGEIRYEPSKAGYFCRCPGESFHTNKTGEKHTILYLDSVPTLSCQHDSCAHVIETFNKVLRSEIGKAEFVPSGINPNGQRVEILKAPEPDSKEWLEVLNKSIVTTTELHGLKLVPREKLLGDWFCEGDLGIEYGPRGAGKTWFALGMGQALSTGGTFGEWKANTKVKVLYIDAEMPPDLIRSRCEGMNAINDNFEILNHEILFDRSEKTINLVVPEQQEAISERCIASQARVLIVDNLSTATSGMKENDSDSWELVNRWLLSLRRRRIAVILLHHAGRSGQMRGTSRREDNVFWIISITDLKKESETKTGTHFLSAFTKQSRNTPADTPAYKWHFETDCDTGIVKITHELAHSLDMFIDVIRSGVTKPIEIAKVMGIEDYAVSRMAKKAIDLNLVERVNRGEYSLLNLPDHDNLQEMLQE